MNGSSRDGGSKGPGGWSPVNRPCPVEDKERDPREVWSDSPIIMHLDMDAFFAAVEQRDDPKLRGRPVIIGGRPGTRGVVSTCSYEARRFGVRSGMPTSRAHSLCPKGVFIRANHRLYDQVSQQIFSILNTISPVVEQVSVDEGFLDLTGCLALHGSPARAAMKAKTLIQEQVGLTCSVGVGPNRLIAKIASDFHKPDGLTVVEPDRVMGFLEPMGVGRLWGVGPEMVKVLGRLGIRTVGELRAHPGELLASAVGVNGSVRLKELARGHFSHVVGQGDDPKSISNETTFKQDVGELDVVRATMGELASRVGTRAREGGVEGRVVFIKVRLAPFETFTVRRTLPDPVNGDDTIFREAWALFQSKPQFQTRPVRLVGVGIASLQRAGSGQLSLPLGERAVTHGAVGAGGRPGACADGAAGGHAPGPVGCGGGGPGKKDKLYRTIDGIRSRFGGGVIGFRTGDHPPRGGQGEDG